MTPRVNVDCDDSVDRWEVTDKPAGEDCAVVTLDEVLVYEVGGWRIGATVLIAKVALIIESLSSSKICSFTLLLDIFNKIIINAEHN